MLTVQADELKVVLLSHDVAHNGVSRADTLANVIDRFAAASIVGFDPVGHGVWAPLKNAEHKIDVVDKRAGKLGSVKALLKTLRSHKCDLLISCKPYPLSFGVALMARRQFNVPVILDIDDWEWGLFKQRRILGKIRRAANIMDIAMNPIYAALLSSLHKRADNILVSNSRLQALYGGTIAYHYRPTTRPEQAGNADELKRRLLLPVDKKIILFFGTPRLHKGIEDLLNAFMSIDRRDYILVVVGASQAQVERLRGALPSHGGGIFILREQLFEELTSILSLSEIVVIPQKALPGAARQLPAKLIDGMTAGKAVVSTDVGDIKEILSDECGLVVKPGCVAELAKALSDLMENDEFRYRLGKNACARARSRFSYEAGEKVLRRVFDETLANHASTVKMAST